MTSHDSLQEVQSVPERLAFDVSALESFLKSAMPLAPSQIAVSKFTGGQSNPTYRLDTEQGAMVLRRKPPGQVLTSAHAVDREARAMRSLSTAGFPVPRIFAECDDPNIIGSPFYVMEYLDGRIFWDPLLPEQTPKERRALYMALTDSLAALHAVDIDSVGLSDFGPKGNYYQRQIERWASQYRASGEEQYPEMEKLISWLITNVPTEGRISVVHGDFRLDNAIFHKDRPEILGVIDWELATLGDPLADLSYFLLNWIIPLNFNGRPGLPHADLTALGIPSLQEITDRYFSRSQITPPTDMKFQHAYNLFRLASILHGISARSRAGNASNDKAAKMGALVRPVALLACGMAGVE